MTTSPVMSVTDELVAELDSHISEPGMTALCLSRKQIKHLLSERAELLRDAERWRSVREMLGDMVELHKERGTVLTIHLDTLRECLEGMQSEAKP